jgi:hypothetical protein
VTRVGLHNEKSVEESDYGELSKFRVEEGSNTCTVALRVVGGHEKGTQCLRV